MFLGLRNVAFAKATLELLGMPYPVLEDGRTDLPVLRKSIEDGFPSNVLRRLQKRGLTLTNIADATGIAERTLKRRLADKRLLPIESDRVLRLAASVASVSDALWCSTTLAISWLTAPHQSLGEATTPLSYLGTEAGLCALDNVLEEERPLQTRAVIDKATKSLVGIRLQRARLPAVTEKGQGDAGSRSGKRPRR